jgi:histidinol-phosphate phosphatase family protein
MTPDPAYDVVIPTTGRASLGVLLATLATSTGPPPRRVVVVDDRPGAPRPLAVTLPDALADRSLLLRSCGRGPAGARNTGWRAAQAPWIVFLDDDVVVPPRWRTALARDLADLPPRVVGCQGGIRVPLDPGRPATDWERNVAALEHARWATADLAYRRAALQAVGGFDERFPRAYREDTDLGLRLAARGLRIVRGGRTVDHPVSPVDRWISVRRQAGNADDALMRALHGRAWRERSGAPRGRLTRHVAVTAAGAVAIAALLAGARRPAAVGAGAWLAGIAELAWTRIAPGPRTHDEVLTMAVTSAMLPAAATAHRTVGEVRARRLARRTSAPVPDPPLAVLLDRDGTLVHDVPYNGDPALVRPLPTVAAALDRLRVAGIRLGLVSNQSGIGLGLLTVEQVAGVTARVVQLLGPFDHVDWCPHTAQDGCRCRKPRPGMLLQTAQAIGVDPLRCAMVGDIGADMEAARAAGMRGILVPAAETRAAEVRTAPEHAATLMDAVDRLLAPTVPLRPGAFEAREGHHGAARAVLW